MKRCSALPAEIWTIIIRHAITQPWPDEQFCPPLDDMAQAKALERVTSSFKAIVESVSRENVQLLSIDEVEKLAPERRQAIRTLFVGFEYCESFLPELSTFTSLSTVSIFSSAGHALAALNCLPLGRSLTRLSLRIDILTWIRYGAELMLVLHGGPPHFERLEELRLYNPPPSAYVIRDDESNLIQIAKQLHAVFHASIRLRLISLQVACDKENSYLTQAFRHLSSIAHPQPSNGNVNKCSACYDQYDHAAVVERELEVSRLLAQSFPNLTTLLWADLWGVSTENPHSRQRATYVHREGEKITLVRAADQHSTWPS